MEKICENCKYFVAMERNTLGGECREEPRYESVLFPGHMIYTKVRRVSSCKSFTPPNKACSRRVQRRGAKVVKSKSTVRVGRTRG